MKRTVSLNEKTATVVTDTAVRYHRTMVAERLPEGGIRLNSGGWHTVTTKRRINQALEMWGSDTRVYQKDFDWLLNDGREFFDGIEV